MSASSLSVFLLVSLFSLLLMALVLGRVRSRKLAQNNLAMGYERRIGTSPVRKVQLSELDHFVIKLTPVSIKEQVSLRLQYCGKQGQAYLVAQLKAKYALLLIGILVAFFASAVSPSSALLALLIPVALFFYPDFRLTQNAQIKKQKIGNLLPDALDQLTLLVDSGLDFQTAFVRVCANSSGPLNDEFQRTLADLQLGIPRKEAFESLGERTGSPILKNFARSMVLADLFGVPVSNVLRSQAAELRNARRAKAEEEAQKVPTKITFPLVACLLPVILILLVGPSILKLLESFS